MFSDQVNKCWKKPDRGIDTQTIEAQFDVKLRKDGTLEAMPVAMTRPSSEFHRVFLESGLRAIIACAPYKLPPALFSDWKWFTPIFDSSEKG
jgi:colicin import membrane protein